jgi:hypothetical protein
MVTDDETLCKPGCIVFTKSMKKSEGSLRFSNNLGQHFTMDVCKTFEKSEFLPVCVLPICDLSDIHLFSSMPFIINILILIDTLYL